MNRKFFLAAGIVALVATVMTVPSDARSVTITNRLSFSRAVALPGVVLAPGSYTFESAPAGTRPDLVRVISNRDDRIMFLGFTRVSHRPYNVSAKQVIQMREVPAGQPAPIEAWYPAGTSTSHEFLW